MDAIGSMRINSHFLTSSIMFVRVSGVMFVKKKSVMYPTASLLLSALSA